MRGMTTEKLALIPLLPLLAAAVTSFMRDGKRASIVAIAALLVSCILSLMAFNEAWGMAADNKPKLFTIPWLAIGGTVIGSASSSTHSPGRWSRWSRLSGR